MTSAEMLFGRKIGEKMTVGEKDFAGFVATEITPRFPDGLTIVDAQGQWRDSETGRLVREPAKLVIVVFRDAPEKRAALRAIADAYKQRFRQQGVAMIVKAACVSF